MPFIMPHFPLALEADEALTPLRALLVPVPGIQLETCDKCS